MAKTPLSQRLAGFFVFRLTSRHPIPVTRLTKRVARPPVVRSAVYCMYFVQATEGRTGLDLFHVAETALHDCAVRGSAGGKFTDTANGMIAIQKLLILRNE